MSRLRENIAKYWLVMLYERRGTLDTISNFKEMVHLLTELFLIVFCGKMYQIWKDLLLRTIVI